MTGIRGALADWPKIADTIGPHNFGPFSREQLARYAAVSGDDNPLHLDPAIAVAAGLAAPPVHGMLMMSCFELALKQWRGDCAITRLAGKFLRPILAGQGISITGRVLRSSLAPRPELILRLMARGPAGDIAIVAEATLAPLSDAGAF